MLGEAHISTKFQFVKFEFDGKLTFSKEHLVQFSGTAHEADQPSHLVVADTERMLQRLIGEHITLHTSMSPDCLWVRADAGQLSQVIVNLAVNARDAMPKGGWLSVATRIEHDCAIVEVADTGQGIPREHLGRIYDPFFTTKAIGQGTGLGDRKSVV